MVLTKQKKKRIGVFVAWFFGGGTSIQITAKQKTRALISVEAARMSKQAH